MRQRIRSIKPEFFRDQKVTRMTPLARLLLIGLFTLSDDEGRLNGDPRAIRSAIFPTDTTTAKQVVKLLDEIVDQGVIVRYEAFGYEWISIVNWKNHQRINRASESTIPPPPNEVERCVSIH